MEQLLLINLYPVPVRCYIPLNAVRDNTETLIARILAACDDIQKRPDLFERVRQSMCATR